MTAVLFVREDALGRPGKADDSQAGSMRAAVTTRVGRFGEVLDAVAAQTRPPERLVVVAVDGLPGSTSPAPVLTQVTELVEGHAGLAAAVPEVVVIGLPAPADLGRALDAALAEVDRRNAPGESVPAEPPAPGRVAAHAG